MDKKLKIFLVFLLIILGKVSGFFKDILITYYHGVSTVTDAFFLSSSISAFVYVSLFSSIPILIVPAYSQIRHTVSSCEINKKLSSYFSVFVFFSFMLCLLTFLCSSSLIDLFAKNVSGNVKSYAINYLSIMSVTFLFSTCVSFCNSIQVVNGDVYPSYIVPLANNLFFCIGIYFFSVKENFWLVLVFGIISWASLFLYNIINVKRRFGIDCSLSFSEIFDKNIYINLLPAMLAFFVEYANSFIGTFYASRLGSGAISVLNYALKINLILPSIVLVFITSSVFPKIARYSDCSDEESLANFIIKCNKFIVILGFPIVFYVLYYANEIITLLFRRGQFDQNDVISVSPILSVLIVSLPFAVSRDIFNRFFYSKNNTLLPLISMCCGLVSNVIICQLTYNKFALFGISFSFVASIVVNFLLVYFLVARRLRYNIVIPIVKYFFISFSCCVFLIVLLNNLSDFINIYWIAVFFPYVILYLLILYLFKINEIVELVVLTKNIIVKSCYR